MKMVVKARSEEMSIEEFRGAKGPKTNRINFCKLNAVNVNSPSKMPRYLHTRLVSTREAAIWNYAQASFHAKFCVTNPTTEKFLL